jgi:hypothetical protein
MKTRIIPINPNSSGINKRARKIEMIKFIAWKLNLSRKVQNNPCTARFFNDIDKSIQGPGMRMNAIPIEHSYE